MWTPALPQFIGWNLFFCFDEFDTTNLSQYVSQNSYLRSNNGEGGIEMCARFIARADDMKDKKSTKNWTAGEWNIFLMFWWGQKCDFIMSAIKW